VKLLCEQVAYKDDHHNKLSVSPNGLFIATGSSGGSVVLHRTKDLTTLWKIPGISEPEPHGFVVTDVTWLHQAAEKEEEKTVKNSMVISVSADYSLLLTRVAPQWQREAEKSGKKMMEWVWIFAVLIFILAIILGILMKS
jgi:hypothetical protein